MTGALILAEDGPHPVRLDREEFHSDPQVLAVSAAHNPEQALGVYSAVRGSGPALIGWFGATQVSQHAAVLVGLDRGLACFADGAQVQVLMQSAKLRGVLSHRQFAYNPNAGAIFGRDLLYGKPVESVRGHLRRLHTTFPDVPTARKAGHRLPSHRMLGPAYRLSWATQRLVADGIDIDEDVLTWLGTFALHSNSISKLQQRYRRWRDRGGGQ